MDKIPSFKDFLALNESLVILSLDKMMKNEFMNNIELKQDYERARRLFFDEGSCIFAHIEGPKFELRTNSTIDPSDMDGIISKINEEMQRFSFKRIGSPKKNILKESVWSLKAKLV